MSPPTQNQQQLSQGPIVYSSLPPTHGQPVAHPVPTATLSPSGQQFMTPFQYYTPTHLDHEPPWVSKVISHINNNKKEIMDKIGEVSVKVTQLEQDMRSVHELNNKVKDMEQTMSEMGSEILRLRNESLYDKGRAMRDNLIFHGIREEMGENIEEVIRNFIKVKLNIDSSPIEIMRCHRMGGRNQQKSRPVVTKFLRYTDKEKIKKAGHEALRNSPFGVSDQYPSEINDRRRQLVPILKQEKQRKGNQARANLVVDRLYTDEYTYTVVNGKIQRSAPQQRRRPNAVYQDGQQAERPVYLQQQLHQIAQQHGQIQQQHARRQQQHHPESTGMKHIASDSVRETSDVETHQQHTSQQQQKQQHQQQQHEHRHMEIQPSTINQPSHVFTSAIPTQHVNDPHTTINNNSGTSPSNVSSPYVHNAWIRPAPPIDQTQTSTTDLLNTDVLLIPMSQVSDTPNNNLTTTAAHLTSHVSGPHTTNNIVNPEVVQSGAATVYNVTNTPTPEVTCWNAPLDELASNLTQVDPLTIPQSDTAWPEMP